MPWLSNKNEWNGTSIVWQVSTESGLTKIDMEHIGLVPEVECYGACEKGWGFYINESLFKLLSSQQGLPNKKKKTPDAVAAM